MEQRKSPDLTDSTVSCVMFVPIFRGQLMELVDDIIEGNACQCRRGERSRSEGGS